VVDLQLDSWEQQGSTVVVVSGELDVATAPQLRQALVALLDDGATRLVLVLDAVGLLDSTGLGVLVGAVKRARGLDGDLVVACDDERVRRVFELTRLDRAIDLFRTVDEAVAG
jgi:anti-sigma B factor antagonist